MDSRLRRDVIWNLVPVALLGIVGLGLNFAIGNQWGAAALGVFNQVTTAFFVVSVLGAGGLQYSVLRAVAEAAEDRDRVAAVREALSLLRKRKTTTTDDWLEELSSPDDDPQLAQLKARHRATQ